MYTVKCKLKNKGWRVKTEKWKPKTQNFKIENKKNTE